MAKKYKNGKRMAENYGKRRKQFEEMVKKWVKNDYKTDNKKNPQNKIRKRKNGEITTTTKTRHKIDKKNGKNRIKQKKNGENWG